MGYFNQAFRGVLWMSSLRGIIRILAFVKLAILARLLLPEQFGVYGIAALILSFLEIFTETGINVFFLQNEGKIKDYISTAWLVSIARGIIVSLAIVALASTISTFFNSPDSIRIIRLIALVPLIRGIINPAIVTYQKELLFKNEFLLRLVVYAVDAMAATALALITKDPSSLVYGLAAGAIAEVIISFVFITPRPKLEFDIAKAKRVINRGKWVTTAGMFDYSFQQGDDIVVGKLLDTQALGFYQNAYKISTLPITEVTAIFGKVALPLYSKISNDSTRLREAFFKVTMAIAVIAVPFGVLLFLFPNPVISVLLGESWLGIVPVLRVLAVYGVVRSVVSSPYTLFLALKKQEYVTYSTLVAVFGLGISVVPLVRRYGIVGAGYATVVGTIISVPVIIYFLNKALSEK